MLEIDVPTAESYDETTSKFVTTDACTVRLEHSLLSVSKWECVWKEAFLGRKEKTTEQTLSYVRLMVLNDDLPPGVWDSLVTNHLEKIRDYIADSMTATRLPTDPNAPQSREATTSELIYYWMISLNVPVEFERWHLNRLLTLIRVINFKNTPQKKMTMSERRNLNRQRLSRRGGRG